MKEIHGVWGAKMVSGDLLHGTRRVLVEDDGDLVRLDIDGVAARLTPDEARFMARQMLGAAGRVERAAAMGATP